MGRRFLMIEEHLYMHRDAPKLRCCVPHRPSGFQHRDTFLLWKSPRTGKLAAGLHHVLDSRTPYRGTSLIRKCLPLGTAVGPQTKVDCRVLGEAFACERGTPAEHSETQTALPPRARKAAFGPQLLKSRPARSGPQSESSGTTTPPSVS